MKRAITFIIGVAIVVAGVYLLVKGFSGEKAIVGENGTNGTSEPVVNGEPEEVVDEGRSVIGRSAGNHDIVAYHFGEGETELLFVGGIHGGYSWNTALVAFELTDFLEANPDVVPENVKVTVVPVMNPDGLNAVVGTTSRFTLADAPSSQTDTVPGRFNANNIDLNRNFDCDWQSTSTWQSREVDAGSSAFSEPEAQAIKSYVEANNPDAVIVWYSAAGGVFTSNCHGGVLEETRELTNVFAEASGYRAFEEFNFYEITGDMTNWLAKEGIPAISVLLTNHRDVEWDKNRAGVEAVLEHYGN